MKSNDIAVIIVVVFIGGIISFFLSGFLFSTGDADKSALVVDPIVTEFKTPDARFFNAESVDPTRVINVGQAQATDGGAGTEAGE